MDNERSNRILSDRYQKITIFDLKTNEVLAVINDENKETPITTANENIVVKLMPYYD